MSVKSNPIDRETKLTKLRFEWPVSALLWVRSIGLRLNIFTTF